MFDWKHDLNIGDFCEHHYQLRPHVVWFGEAVPMMEKAIQKVTEADIIVIIGTSMQVYPAAGLIDFAPQKTPIYFIDPNPNVKQNKYLTVYAEKAVTGVSKLAEELRKKFIS